MSQKRAQICFAEIVLVSALEGLDHPKELILRIQLLSTSPCALWEAPPESKHRSALKCSHLSWTDPQKCWPFSVLHFSACCPARKFEAFPAAASRLFLSGLNFGALPAKFVSASKSEWKHWTWKALEFLVLSIVPVSWSWKWIWAGQFLWAQRNPQPLMGFTLMLGLFAEAKGPGLLSLTCWISSSALWFDSTQIWISIHFSKIHPLTKVKIES